LQCWTNHDGITKNKVSRTSEKVSTTTQSWTDIGKGKEKYYCNQKTPERRQKTKASSNVKLDNVIEQPMRKKIESSREFAVKRKNRPGKARKPVRTTQVTRIIIILRR
jgi:predicted phage gp36 major capsid-like protein